MIGLLKTVVLAVSLEGGLIPGHNLAMFETADMKSRINLQTTYYSDFQAYVEIFGHLNLYGGLTSYVWHVDGTPQCYPFRMDYKTGISIKIGDVEVGFMHDCFHPINPYVIVLPYGKIDASNNRLFIKAELRGHVFQ